MEENRANNRVRGLKPFKPGQSGNPKGRAKGKRDYATLFREAIIKIATLNKIDPESIEATLVQKGISEALKGDYRFYKDHLDRMHGQATQKIAGDKDNPLVFLPLELLDKYNLNEKPPSSTSDNRKG